MNTIGNSYNLLPISEISDKDKPLSFQIWKNSFEIILPEQAYTQYNNYLLDWYKNKKATKDDLTIQTKINFLNLLKQIQVYFTEEEKENWYSGIDIDNEKEVLLAIPYFARKLKNISLYYLQLREQIKRSKLKYNLAGSNKSVVKQIQNIILQDYSKKDDFVVTLPSTLWAHVPQLSSIKNSIVIEVEELYDTASYFDRSTSLPASAYFPLDTETEKYFLTKGINLSGIDWVYRLGTFTLSALYDASLQGTTDPNLSSLYIDLAEKYLGSNFYSTLIINSSAKKDFYTINIQPGNNFFYYPSGPYKLNVSGLPRYKPEPLSATSLQTLGTAGSSLEFADTIFVKTKKGVEGAWFRKKLLDVADINMKATIEGSTSTIFRFPYPGYGISAEDIEWTGYSAITDPRYFYLDDTTKKLIEEVYWGSSFSLSGVVPISINSTSLINNGAYASTDFNAADKIRVWSTPPQFNETSYNGEVKEAWLYKFLNTNISIGAETDNTIVWPYFKIINPKDDKYTLPDLPYNICLSQSISSLSLPYATGSSNLSSSDVIYKINNYRDTKEQAIECAWLSATNYSYPNSFTYGPRQTHFSILFKPGTYTYFIWDYNDKININTVINGDITHTSDCNYITSPNSTYKNHKLCNCKQVYFAPFGHPGNNFYDYNGLCDFIVEDIGYLPETTFNISKWRDQNGLSFFESPAACWFKTEQNIGWGSGTWYSGATATGNTFYLQKGKRYIYYRANVRDKNIETNSFPELVVRQTTPSNSKGIWINATKDKTGNWISTGEPSTMSINSNDFLIYSRSSSTYFNITGTYIVEQRLAENRGSIWSNYDYVTVNNPNISITISYPTILSKRLPLTTANANDPYKQYPNVPSTAVQRILRWEITDPNNNVESYINQPVATFVPAITGLYTIKLTAVTASQDLLFTPSATGCYYFTNIPPITCDPDTIRVPSLSTFNISIPGFVLNTDLKGWNYTTNTQTNVLNDLTGNNNIGAVPIWVKSNLNKTPETEYKTIESWSPALSFWDTYNPINFYEVSDITLKGGERIEYKRKPQTRIVWDQNVIVNNITNTNQWCKLETSLNNSPTPFNPTNNLISKPTTEPSTLLLQNIVENEPVEVYYNSLNFFTWNISAEPQITEIVYSAPLSSIATTNLDPWSTLTNQFYPTVAHLPTFDKIVNVKQLGAYFKPANLGLLTYIDKDYTFELSLSSVKPVDVYSNPTQKINNRGLSKEKQFTPYSITLEDNTWLKEPYTTGSLAGTVKKSVFKKYQKFIPYQSTYETNPLTHIGLITPVSRQHPWGGPQDTNWADPANRPINFTGEISVSHWVNDQVLKNTTLQLDNWCTDVYGNQYGLYKEIKGISPSERIAVTGQIWIRKNSQQTEPGYTALLDVFDTYKTISMYNELTGTGVYKIDTFYDTLFIETSGAIIFEKINYDYSAAGIFSIADSARGISLVVPSQNNLNREFTNTLPENKQYAKAGDTWFFAKERTVIISVIELQGNSIVPYLYSYDLNKNILKKAFTISADTQTFDNLNAVEVSRPVLSYCSTKKQFLYTFVAKNTDNKDIIISLNILNASELTLTDINVYTPQTEENLPPTILSDLNLTLPVSAFYTQQIDTTPSNCIFEPINFPEWATLTNTGTFTCLTPITPETYNLSFLVSNSVGPVYTSLNITVV